MAQANRGLPMASFEVFVRDGVQPGARERVFAQALFWFPVGTGTVTAFEPYAFRFEGNVASMLFTGDLVIDLELLDRDAAAEAGPCFVGLNARRSMSAHYRIDGDRLVIAAQFDEYDQEVAIRRSPCGRQTLIACSGRYNTVVRLEPEA